MLRTQASAKYFLKLPSDLTSDESEKLQTFMAVMLIEREDESKRIQSMFG